MLPVLRSEGREYDLYHIDGGHNFWMAHADLCNVMDFSRRGGTLLVDDVNDPMTSGLCDYYVLNGRLSRMTLNTLWSETIDHELFRIHPR